MNYSRRLLFIIVILASSLRLFAQYEATSGSYDYLHFNHLKENLGIENMVVNHVYEDKDGYIWFSTETGLSRFDGQQMKFFQDNQNAQPIQLQSANAFCQGQNGDILIGSDGSLFVYRCQQEQFSKIECAFKGQLIPKSIASLKIYDDKLWMGTEQGLYFAAMDDSLTFMSVAHSDTKEDVPLPITSLLIGPGHHLWVGSRQNGLFMLKKDSDTNYHLKSITLEGMASPSILDLVTYDNYHLLAITDKGLITIDSKQQQKTILTCDKITAVSVTSSGGIWCSTFGEGLYLIKDLTARPVKYINFTVNNNTLNFINTSFVDSKDNLWIVPEKMGVRWLSNNHRFIKNHAQSHFKDGLRNNIVKDIKIDGRGRWFIGTYYGLSIYDPITQTYEQMNCTNDELSTNQIESMVFDHNGGLWVGTRDGLHYLAPGAAEMRRVTALPQQIVWSLCLSTDAKGIWIGTDKGLHKMNISTGDIATYNLHDNAEDKQPEIVTLLEDSQKSLWVGTHGNGLYRAENADDGVKPHFIPMENGLIKDRYIYALYEAADHSIWIGGKNGLHHYHNSQVEQYKGEEGKGYNIIKGITEDRHHRLWLTSHLGIISFDPTTKERVNYNTIDGMSSDIFNMGACQITDQGQLLAGSLKGIVEINIDSLQKKRTPYPIPYISHLSVNNLQIKANVNFNGRVLTDVAPKHIKSVRLNHDENNLSITFGFIEMNHPQRIQCAYRVPEQDDQWHTLPEGQNTINLFNLSKGNYTLEYKTTNADGQWNSEIQRVPICILPHWSRTSWAYALYVALCLLLFIYILSYQKRKIKEKENIVRERALHKQTLALEKDKIEFFTNISHELRTPLTLILAPLHELKAKKETLSPEQKAYYLNLMSRNIQMLDRLIEQLLNFSKIQNGKVRLHPGYHNLPQLVKQVVSTFTEYAAQKNIAINVIDKTTLSNVICDSHAIETILSNLLSNAVKYSHEGGHIELTLSVPANRENTYCISVKDEGIGISEKNLKDIFKRYARMENADKKAGGIGIGLAYTQSLVHLHQGEITVESQLGEGSCFNVYLPIKMDDVDRMLENFDMINRPTLPEVAIENPRKPESAALLHRPSGTLLIVEDNKELQSFLQQCFCERYQILLANNGKEGLALAGVHLPDLIISDVMMPEMDGIEMTRKIKENYITSHIPIIMLTAKAEVKDELEGLNSGANFYLKKPFLPQQLELIVKNIQDQQLKMREHLLAGNTTDKGESAHRDTASAFLQKASDYVRENLSSLDLNVETLSEAMHMSSVHLYRKMKQEGDITPNDFIRNIRMECAIEMLLAKDKNVAEVAYSVGYSDPKYFSKCFKTLYGMSPSAYVKAKSAD